MIKVRKIWASDERLQSKLNKAIKSGERLVSVIQQGDVEQDNEEFGYSYLIIVEIVES